MRNKINKHPCLLALVSVLLIVVAFIGSNVIAGVQDRSSKVDLVPDPDNYIRLPNIGKPSNFLRPDPRVLASPPDTPTSGASIFLQTGRGIFNTPPTNEAWLGNDEGNLMYKGEVQLAIAGKTVLIDDVSDLTFLTGDTSGNSIFWMDWGNHYIVDFYSIQHSGGTNAPVSGTTQINISGISGVFRSVLEKDDQKTITVEIAETISGGYTLLSSGSSILQIWAPLNSGATVYGGVEGSGVTAIVQGDSGTTTQTMWLSPNEITTVAAGGYDSSVRYLGDKKTWKAQYLAGVSVVPFNESLIRLGKVQNGLSGTTVGGFTITGPSQGSIFLVDVMNTVQEYSQVGIPSKYSVIGNNAETGGGVTVTLPTVTAILDGWEITIGKKEEAGLNSGTTEIVPYGTAVGTESGTTPGDGTAAIILNDVGDMVTLMASYNTGVSWFVKSYHVND